MAKLKFTLCVFVISSLSAFVVAFSDSRIDEPDQLENPNPNVNPAQNTQLSFVLERLTAQERRIQELEKSKEECKSLKISYKTVHEELKEQIKSLKKEVDEMKQEMKQDHGLWLLAPPLRGPPGKNGKQGEKGEPGGPAAPSSVLKPKGGDLPVLAPQSITSCSDAMKIPQTPRSTKQIIYPHGNSNSKKRLEVLCDFDNDGGGWTIIQKRSSGPQRDFDRNWDDYAKGFGSMAKNGNFWLGLDNIHALTKNGDQELRIELEDFEGGKRYAKYTRFSVSDASDFYRLTISGYSGNAVKDMLSLPSSWAVHNGMRFSTKDKDNDNKPEENCAADFSGGWWYDRCFNANLNGLYREKSERVPWAGGIIWGDWRGWQYSLAKTEMKIRKRA